MLPHSETPAPETDAGAPGEQAKIFERRAELFIEAVPLSLVSTLVSAGVLAWFLSNSVTPMRVGSWMGAVTALCLAGLWDHRAARGRLPAQGGLRRQLRREQLGVLLSGALWGSAGLFLFPADNPAHQGLLAAVVVGISAVHVNSFSAFLFVSRGFLVLALAPLCAQMAQEHSEMGYAIALLALLYLALMLTIARRCNNLLLKTLNLAHARSRAEDMIVRQAYYDGLTGLPNRLLLRDRIELDLARHLESGRIGALLFLDIDHFQRINDTLGRNSGDDLLRAVAGRITNLLGDNHTIARPDGNRFVIVLSDLAQSGQDAANRARHWAENLRRILAVPFELGEREVHLGSSVGIALYPGDGNTPEDVLCAAESALTRAKTAGRDCTRLYLPQMQTTAKGRMDLEAALRRALRQDGLSLHYQPQCLRNGRIVSAEALLRWPRADAEDSAEMVASPAVFVPIAEEGGLIHELGRWVITRAMRDIETLARETGARRPERIAVNVSPVQFHQASFATALAARLSAEQLEAKGLELEITEQLLLGDFQDTARKMAMLRELGVHFSVDDFGTGYSSLSYLKRLPLDALKIDRAFVRDVNLDKSDAAIVETIIDMAHRLGLGVVAEGVETELAADFLEQRGCDRFQGFLFYRPMPLNALIDTLRAQHHPAD